MIIDRVRITWSNGETETYENVSDMQKLIKQLSDKQFEKQMKSLRMPKELQKRFAEIRSRFDTDGDN